MRLEPQIQFLGMERSEALEAAARARIARLERHAAGIIACRLAIELDHKHSRQGRPVRVRIDLSLPGRELVVDRIADEDAYVALRDAFDDMRRRLDALRQQRRGEVKHHAPEQRGVVDRLDAEGGFGFIRSADGEDFYFGRSNLAGLRFEQLTVGQPVRFIVEAASDGLQAHRVSLGRPNGG
jgi:ribosomal subunit interface protein